MTKTGKKILTALMIAMISLSAVPMAVPMAAESVSQQQSTVQGSYAQSTDTATFTGSGTVTAELFEQVCGVRNSIDTIVLSDGVTGIADLGKMQIRRIILGKDVVQCDAYVTSEYRLDPANTAFEVYDSALYNADYRMLIRVPTKKTNLTYPDGLVAIGSYAFDGNEADIIVVPWGVTSILECGLRSKGQVKVVPDTVTRFDLPSSYRDPAGVYLWAGENDVIEKAAEVYSLDGQKDQFEALSTYWQTFCYRRISDVCNGTKGEKITGWYTISGRPLYFLSNGQPATEWQQIGRSWYYFDGAGQMQTGMLTIESGYTDAITGTQSYYFDQNGVLLTNTEVKWKGKTYTINKWGIASEKGTAQPELDGLVTQNGKTYYYVDGIRQTGLHYINGKAYIFDRNGVMQKSGWYEAEGDSFYLNDYGAGVVKCWRLGTDGKYRYLKADGRMAVNEWIVDYGKTYYLGADGKKYTGTRVIDGESYTFDSNGVLITETTGSHKPGLQYINGKAYIFDENGQMLRSGWYTADGSSFYLNDYGAGVVKCWRLGTDGKYRYLKANGRMATNEWVVDYGKTYYVGADGKKYTGTRVIDGKSYTFDSNGVLITDPGSGSSSSDYAVKYVNGKAYIYDGDGQMLRSGWYTAGGASYYLNDYGAGVVKCWRLGTDGKYRYLGADGKMKTNCWIKDYGRWYYVKGDGTRYESCWVKFGDKWYWFGGSGKMAESQWLTLNGKKYYFTESGAMAANRWIQDGKYWHYLGADGTILTNTRTPDGYRVDSQGRLV
ncbi:MAG TPA: hypothetical protein IAC40_04090 [Candidatus Faecivivens stercorigallinarum]|nr:hypothetical protein [Candidatus Faecivivens stercorigallinarum]